MSEFGESRSWAEGNGYALPRPAKGAKKKALVITPVGGGGDEGKVSEVPEPGVSAKKLPLPGRKPVGGALPPVRGKEDVPVVESEGSESEGYESVVVPLPEKGKGGLPLPGGGLPLPDKSRQGRPKKGMLPVNVQSSLVSSDEGWDEDNPAFEDADSDLDRSRAAEFVSASRGVRITPRDIEIIRMLARFRYAQGVQVARYVGSTQKAVDQRLTKLGKAGLLRREDVTRGQSLWTPTGWGLSTADLDFRAIGEGKISYVTIAHTLGLGNIGIELETGQENLLKLEEWPQANRVNSSGEVVTGETLITEREIRQGEQRWKKSMARIDMEQSFRLALAEWWGSDRTEASPELQVGNEAMLILWATKAGRSDHVPDLVLARPRQADGSPGTHAVELELHTKPVKEWTRILESFVDAKDLYAHVHYFTHKKSIADALNRIAEEVGLVAQGRWSLHKYTPRSGNLPFWG